MIISAKPTISGNTFIVTLDFGKILYVPDDFENTDRQELQEWVDAGGIIGLADPLPPPPTDKELAESEIRKSKALLALGKMITGNDALTENDLVVLIKAKL